MSNRISNQIPNRISDREHNDTATTQMVFADPVAYLATFGLAAEMVAETALPVAA